MNQQTFLKIFGLTLLVVAATVGIAFIVAPTPINGGRFCLGLLPIVFAEFLLGGVILMTSTDNIKSARLLFGISRAWTCWLYLGFTVVAALLVAIGTPGAFLAILHILAAVALILWNVLGDGRGDQNLFVVFNHRGKSFAAPSIELGKHVVQN